MPWNESLNPAVSVLASLYPDDSSAKRIASEAGLRPERIDFSSSAINIWQQLLEEALRDQKMPRIFGLARQEYPDNPQLEQAVGHFKPNQTLWAELKGRRVGWGWVVGLVVLGLAGFWGIRMLGPKPLSEPPGFDVFQVFSDPKLLSPVELAHENSLSDQQANQFLRLSALEMGNLKTNFSGATVGKAYNIKLTVKNVFTEPILLDINQRFFSLEDSLGKASQLVYFCCTAKGSLLSVGEEREFRLLFELPAEWKSKSGSARAQLKVEGLRPVLRARWLIPLPQVAN